MTPRKQTKRNRAYAKRVKADNGRKRCFGVTNANHEFGVLAGREYGRGTMNGIPLSH
jgi:hypothetical protein